jgi:hypothetical protein
VNGQGESSWERLDVVGVVWPGVVGGILGGAVFAVAQVIVAALSGHPASQPVQVVGAMLLGDRVLGAGDLTASVVVAALAIHLVLSVLYGIVLALIAAAGLAATGSRWLLVVTGLVWGFFLWLVNFYVIAPVAFPWFETLDDATQLVLHTVFYGGVLGWYLSLRLARGTASSASGRR